MFLFDVRQDGSGDLSDKTYRTCWHINSIDFPADWSFDRLSVDEFKQIVIEAFTAETLRTSEPGWVKNTNVVFLSDFETKN